MSSWRKYLLDKSKKDNKLIDRFYGEETLSNNSGSIESYVDEHPSLLPIGD